MKPYVATILLSVVLIVMSAWGYLSSETPSMTALIPAGFGLLLGFCSIGLKKENRVVAHISVALVILLTLALFMPLKGAIGRGDTLAIVRVSTMLLALIGTLVVYIRSFIDARRSQSG